MLAVCAVAILLGIAGAIALIRLTIGCVVLVGRAILPRSTPCLLVVVLVSLVLLLLICLLLLFLLLPFLNVGCVSQLV